MKTKAFILGVSLLLGATSTLAGPGDGDLLNILKNSGARSSLNLSQGVIGQLDSLFGGLERKLSELVSKASPEVKIGGFSLGKAKDPLDLQNKVRGEFRGQMMKLLDANQLRQALQMGVKTEGNWALLMPEVAKEIALDKVTKKAIEGYRREYFDLDKLLGEKVKKGEMTESDKSKQLIDKDALLQKAIGDIVKPEQLDKLKQLGGN